MPTVASLGNASDAVKQNAEENLNAISHGVILPTNCSTSVAKMRLLISERL
jgi:hypothetical protein